MRLALFFFACFIDDRSNILRACAASSFPLSSKVFLVDRRLLMLALGMFAMGTDNFVVAGILPGVAASLGTSVSVAGQMVTVYALSFAILAPIMAAVAGGWPRKTLLVSALGIFVVGNIRSR